MKSGLLTTTTGLFGMNGVAAFIASLFAGLRLASSVALGVIWRKQPCSA